MPRLPESGRLRVLDPGAGCGSLAASFVARVLNDAPRLSLEVLGIEVDHSVANALRETFTDCAETARRVGVQVDTQVLVGDFLDLAHGLDRDESLRDYDIVIMNPPYRKLGAKSRERTMMAALGAECPNLYSAFLALGAEVLRPSGQLVAITPRSFANGPYFGRFRQFLLEKLALDRIHVFESRSTVFADTRVLQENVIISGTRNGTRGKIVISVSNGHKDRPHQRVAKYDDVVKAADPHRFIRIAADDTDIMVAESVTRLPCRLHHLGLEVSTGRVVDFRSKPNLCMSPAPDTVPLVYPGNMRGGRVEWPLPIRKHQGFRIIEDRDRRLLLPAGVYVLVKRFSAKEERRRVVAGVWDGAAFDGPVAFENHLNVFHVNGRGLGPQLARGLSVWLNSSVVDRYFRTFSGHTQVNATDLRSLHYPPAGALCRLGERFIDEMPDQARIDGAVADVVLHSEVPA
jgi:adenine-specific DNA-methyltransferase